jgi:hypothetical protein
LTLSELTDGHLTFFQSSIKQELIKLVELELKLAKNALNTLYCRSVAALGITISINRPDVNMVHSKDLIALLFEEGSAALLKHIEITTPRNSSTHLKSPPTTPSQHINSLPYPLIATAAYSLQSNPSPTF